MQFLDAGTDINACNENGLTALHLAAKEGNDVVVRELLSRGAKVDGATKVCVLAVSKKKVRKVD